MTSVILSSTTLTLLSTLTTLSSTPATLLSTAATLSTTPLTLSPTVCVAFRFCAMPIQASSWVSLSNLFSASSMSVLPISFFAYFSNHRSINSYISVQQMLTYSALSDFLRCDPKDRQNLNHNLNDYTHHFRGRLSFCVALE